jgi:mRNA-degrading endonuclease RelE of RelBE toxin-antitoxin system
VSSDTPYKIVLTRSAESEIDRLSPDVRELLKRELKRLARNPFGLARKTVSPPYPAGGMMREFDARTVDGVMHYFVVLFWFAEDEERLIIHGVGHRA